MTTKKEAPDAEWAEYADQVIESINDGDLDFALKRMIKAAVTRAKDARLVPEGTKSKNVALTQDHPRGKQKKNTVTDAKGVEYPVLVSAIKPIKHVSNVDDIDDTLDFVYGNFVYRKADLKGKALRIPHNSNHSWQGKMVVVGGVGPDKVMIHPVTENDRGSMTLPLGGEKGFISKRFLDPFFGQEL
jgi:hypothetical protein